MSPEVVVPEKQKSLVFWRFFQNFLWLLLFYLVKSSCVLMKPSRCDLCHLNKQMLMHDRWLTSCKMDVHSARISQHSRLLLILSDPSLQSFTVTAWLDSSMHLNWSVAPDSHLNTHKCFYVALRFILAQLCGLLDLICHLNFSNLW